MDLTKIPDYAMAVFIAILCAGFVVTAGMLFQNARYDRRHRKLKEHLDQQHTETVALFKDVQEQAGIRYRSVMHTLDKMKPHRNAKGQFVSEKPQA